MIKAKHVRITTAPRLGETSGHVHEVTWTPDGLEMSLDGKPMDTTTSARFECIEFEGVQAK